MRLAFLLLGFTLLLGCPEDPMKARAHDIVAHIGDKKVHRKVLLAELSRLGLSRIEAETERLALGDTVLDRMIRERMLAMAADEAGIKVDSKEIDREVRKNSQDYLPGQFSRMLTEENTSYKTYRDHIEAKLKIKALIKKELGPSKPISDVVLRARYDEKKIEPRHMARARQIVVRTRAEADHVQNEIRVRRVSVEDAAKKYSISPEAERGGDLGWFAKSEMPEVFSACFDLEPGQISEIVPSEHGFHIFELLEKRDPEPVPFESIRAQLENEIREEFERKMTKALLARLHKQFVVKKDLEGVRMTLEQLPFDRKLAEDEELTPAQKSAQESAMMP